MQDYNKFINKRRKILKLLAILLNGIYFLLWFIVTPIIPIIFIYRILSGKENYKRIYERIGYSSLKRPNKKLIWVNAVSLGELRSTIPLIKILLQQNYSILITTVTLTSASHVKTIINKIDNKNNLLLYLYNFLCWVLLVFDNVLVWNEINIFLFFVFKFTFYLIGYII